MCSAGIPIYGWAENDGRRHTTDGHGHTWQRPVCVPDYPQAEADRDMLAEIAAAGREEEREMY